MRYSSVSVLIHDMGHFPIPLSASKIYSAEHGYDSTLKAIDNSLERFQFGTPPRVTRIQLLRRTPSLPRPLPDS